MAFAAPRFLRQPQAAWWTLFAGLALTATIGWVMHREAVEMDRRRLAMRVAEVQAQLDARLEKSEMLLHNLRDYLMFSGETRPKVFERWCYENGLSINCSWLHGIAVATNRYKSDWRSQLPRQSGTWTKNDFDDLASLAREHPIECHIALTSEVRDRKQFLADYDLRPAFLDEDSRPSKEWLTFTIRLSSRLGMSDRRTVMLDANSTGITGTLFCVPIHKPQFSTLVTNEIIYKHVRNHARWLDLESLIIAPVDFNALAQSVWDGAPADVGIEIFSSTNQTVETWLNISPGRPRAADPEFKTYLTQRQLWRMYGLKFSIFFYTTPLFEAQSPRRLAKIAMIAGTVLTVLASALVGVALRARNRQERMTEQIREARDALAAAQQEREQLSRDLHDGTIQSLYAIQLGLGHTAQKFEAEPAQARHEFSVVRRELDAVIAEIRQFITAEARSDGRVEFGTVLQALVERVRNGTTARFDLQCDPGASDRLTGTQAVHLANIAREALSNSLRHAQPQRVTIRLSSGPDFVVLEIADDGRGFDSVGAVRSGVGLTSMAARALEIGSVLEIQSAPGQGTRVSVRVTVAPLESAEAEAAGESTTQS